MIPIVLLSILIGFALGHILRREPKELSIKSLGLPAYILNKSGKIVEWNAEAQEAWGTNKVAVSSYDGFAQLWKQGQPIPTCSSPVGEYVLGFREQGMGEVIDGQNIYGDLFKFRPFCQELGDGTLCLMIPENNG